MVFHHRRWWVTGFCLLTFCVHAKTSVDVFGKRYCEIVSTNDFSNFVIYNSNNVEDCPHHWWSALNAMKLKRYLKARFVHLQGPHIWMVDRIIYSNSQYSKMRVEGKNFLQVGRFQIEWNKLLQHHGPYIDYPITKNHIFVINQGRQIYQLKDPYGHYYVLYGLSIQFEDIKQLKSQLKLPPGWIFMEGTVALDSTLNAKGGLIHIVQDNLNNNYQRVSKNLLQN